MSEQEKSAFYGYDDWPTVSEVMLQLFCVTGSEALAKELIEAADFVESLARPGMAFTAMPEWVS